jgi:Domain of Unknown Function (DUF1206)
MATAKSASLKQAGSRAAHKAKRAATGGWIEGLERWGYVARGALYIIMGALALQLALGSGGHTADPVGVLHYIAVQPYGKVLMAAMVVGLAGYSLWGFFRALFDALDKGSDIGNWGCADEAGSSAVWPISSGQRGGRAGVVWHLLGPQRALVQHRIR